MSGIPFVGNTFPKHTIQPKCLSCPGHPYCSVCPSRKDRSKSSNKTHGKPPEKHSSSSKAETTAKDAATECALKPACRGRPHCMLCMDRPENPSFLDCIIEGIDYLDRSLNDMGSAQPSKSGSKSSSKSGGKSKSKAEEARGGASSKKSPTTSPSKTSQDQGQQNPSSTSLQCRPDSKGSLSTTVLPKAGATNLQEDPWMGASIPISHIPKLFEKIRAGWAAPPDPNAALWW
ncbi:uncharacterized protein LOC103096251 [Monodelphis domestica]|uniref:uncharacterized protein LOC103096251 n=1 Tax=Monodelphis domestica TaxID=13616 RepID=UPI000443454C|nr:uncharacterized protein LOC103096251 [Monodelphis domestica]XP_007491284.1 uncharacterized protein LOC103096251 [Monodelphis domestica]XP_007491285.1 uncharacterized protein LOC103096251 [Monodelphis domestica]XP_007491287.1 uncharacterized protein LOC103096251 [Monodelphis domestica]XP_056651598.1 uncharacterized protein LOC103096251 [Monodelphis domestica]